MDRSTILVGTGLAAAVGLLYMWNRPRADALDVEDGLLKLPSLLKLLRVIQKQVAEELVIVKANFVRDRLSSKGEKLQEHVKQYIQAQQDAIEHICEKNLKKYDITSKVFDRSLEVHGKHPVVIALTNCYDPLSNSTIAGEATPATLDIDTFYEILIKHLAMYKQELKLGRTLTPQTMVSFQALISDSVFAQFGFNEMQVSAASYKYRHDEYVEELLADIRKSQTKLLFRARLNKAS